MTIFEIADYAEMAIAIVYWAMEYKQLQWSLFSQDKYYIAID
jgi:hypothetical protein